MPSHHDVAVQLLDVPQLPEAATGEELFEAVRVHAMYDPSLAPHVARFRLYMLEKHITTVGALGAAARIANSWNFLMDKHPRLPRAAVLIIRALADPTVPLHEPFYSTIGSIASSIINSLWSEDRKTGPGCPHVGGSRAGSDDHFVGMHYSGHARTHSNNMGSAINHGGRHLRTGDRALCDHETSAVVLSSVRRRRVGPSYPILKK